MAEPVQWSLGPSCAVPLASWTHPAISHHFIFPNPLAAWLFPPTIKYVWDKSTGKTFLLFFFSHFPCKAMLQILFHFALKNSLRCPCGRASRCNRGPLLLAEKNSQSDQCPFLLTQLTVTQKWQNNLCPWSIRQKLKT